MSEEKREPCFWTCDDACERLTHEDQADAVEEALDNLAEPGQTAEQFLASLPEELEVYGYARSLGPSEKQRDWLADGALEILLEGLDQDYGDPDDATEETEAMKQAAREFVDAVLAEYSIWACEQICIETVKPREWVKEHRPDWLKD